jgi:hypothetical protein
VNAEAPWRSSRKLDIRYRSPDDDLAQAIGDEAVGVFHVLGYTGL